jgi:hypothetical protein
LMDKMRRPEATTLSPFSVNLTPGADLSNSVQPTTSCSRLICVLTSRLRQAEPLRGLGIAPAVDDCDQRSKQLGRNVGHNDMPCPGIYR